MTRYTVGANFERKVKKVFESYGWDVTRSAGSRGVADLVAIDPWGTVVKIQCKIDGILSKLDRSDLIANCLAFKCVPVLAYKDKREIKFLELFVGAPMPWHPGE